MGISRSKRLVCKGMAVKDAAEKEESEAQRLCKEEESQAEVVFEKEGSGKTEQIAYEEVIIVSAEDKLKARAKLNVLQVKAR